VSWYRKGGVAEVVSHKMGGKGQVPYLTDEAEEQVAREVATGRFRTAGEIRDWIAEEYGVTYKMGGIYPPKAECTGCDVGRRYPVPCMPRLTRGSKPSGKRGVPPSPYGSWGDASDPAWIRR